MACKLRPEGPHRREGFFCKDGVSNNRWTYWASVFYETSRLIVILWVLKKKWLECFQGLMNMGSYDLWWCHTSWRKVIALQRLLATFDRSLAIKSRQFAVSSKNWCSEANVERGKTVRRKSTRLDERAMAADTIEIYGLSLTNNCFRFETPSRTRTS